MSFLRILPDSSDKLLPQFVMLSLKAPTCYQALNSSILTRPFTKLFHVNFIGKIWIEIKILNLGLWEGEGIHLETKR